MCICVWERVCSVSMTWLEEQISKGQWPLHVVHCLFRTSLLLRLHFPASLPSFFCISSSSSSHWATSQTTVRTMVEGNIRLYSDNLGRRWKEIDSIKGLLHAFACVTVKVSVTRRNPSVSRPQQWNGWWSQKTNNYPASKNLLTGSKINCFLSLKKESKWPHWKK